ncbi:MAG: sigma-70 family RNA polymerase sigma factor [Sphingobacteriales bacterium]|nr:MAG: sigma-70 family RNA polymerase sigma factor [Sphingobacteriales bacterium]
MRDSDKYIEMQLAYTEIIKRYSITLFDFGIRFCQDEEIVKDCIQQLFLDLWNKSFDITERDTLKSYLFKAVRNRVIREKAKWQKNSVLTEDYEFTLEFGIESKIIAIDSDLELAKKVKKLLNALPPRQREIIYLRFYEGLDIPEISDVMGINRQSAHNLLQKAYEKIRGEWQLVLLILGIWDTQHM